MFERSSKNQDGTTMKGDCPTCGGYGEVWTKSLHPDGRSKETLVVCHACNGTKHKGDQLRKVMPMDKPDLMK